MIPKTVHFYWGNSTMSWMRYMTLYSFKKLNPDWQVNLHTVNHVKDTKRWSSREIQDSFNFSGKDYLEQAKSIPGIRVRSNEFAHLANMSPAQASDMFSWSILASEGGFYSDLDILYVRPMSSFYEQVKDFDAVLGTVRLNVFGIGFMASGGNNALFKTASATARRLYHPTRYESAGNNVLNVMAGNVSHNIGRKFGLRIHFMDTLVVYRWTHKQIGEIFEQVRDVPEPTLGIHWFGGHPIAQAFNNLLTHETYQTHKNTFTESVAQLMR
jgi:mannosyltransferase OCH1-like enzyme